MRSYNCFVYARFISVSSKMAVMMAASEKAFEDSISYGLSRIGRPELTLKPQQLEAVRYIYEEKDVFLWLPTGFGKSVCFC